MADYLKDFLKNQLIELFDDVLRLNTVSGKQRCILEIGRGLTERTKPDTIMLNLGSELIKADIDKLENNSEDLFDYIFSCLTKKQIENENTKEIIKETFKNLYNQLSQRERKIVTDYARQMKKICEKYHDDKKCQILLSE
jgi:hypothetical protein